MLPYKSHIGRHKDIFLDGLNPDYRYRGSIHRHLSERDHVNTLIEFMSIAVFLCGKHCVMPPTFVLECQILNEAVKHSMAFFENEVIVWPMREENPVEMWEKKQREYRIVLETDYPHLASRHGLSLLLGTNARAIRPRISRVGVRIASQWRIGPDITGPWDKVKPHLPANTVDQLRMIPDRLLENDIAVTTNAILSQMQDEKKIVKPVEYLLQNAYGRIYIDEFGLAVLKNPPFFRHSFDLSSLDPYYDCNLLREALTPLDLWPIHKRLSPDELIFLRSREGFFSFIDAYMRVTAEDPENTHRYFSIAASKLENTGHSLPMSWGIMQPSIRDANKINTLSAYLNKISGIVQEQIADNNGSQEILATDSQNALDMIDFSVRERQMISLLLENRGGCVPKGMLVYKFSTEENVRSIVGRINKKVFSATGIRQYIDNDRGVGYFIKLKK